MMYKDTFSSYHPVINFLYFGLVLFFSMCFMHPLFLAVSIITAIIYNICLHGKKTLRFLFIFILPVILPTALINPLFNHKGATILCYLPSGNPLTLESINYGLATSVMLAAVVLWFSCYNEIMTSDKFVYLFGRCIPVMSLVLSMTLRFVPKLKAQIKLVSEAQKCVGRDVTDGGIIQRFKNAVTILSIIITWSLENALETADSMKSRGYGLKGRTAFSIYCFNERDQKALIWLIFCGAYIIFGWSIGSIHFRYYPTMKGEMIGGLSMSFMLCYMALNMTPVILNKLEDLRWARLKKKK